MLGKDFKRDGLIRGRQLVTVAGLATALASGGSGVARTVSAAENSTILVNNVEQLYAAVNDAANIGAAVVLSPGVYTLSLNDANGEERRNRGRLDLQTDMSLLGVEGDRGAVVIDPSSLPESSFQGNRLTPSLPGRTGVIRVGRGSNAIEWLTIAGNRFAAAAVETDLVETDQDGPRPTTIKIAHVMAGDIARGIDIRNITTRTAGRRLKAVIEDNDFFWGVEGIRVINFQGAHGGNISVAMQGNRSYANRLGCIIENNRSNFAKISVVSRGDRFEDNGLGCQIGGGLTGAPGETNFNVTKFEAHGSAFTNNTRTEFNPEVTGPDFTDAGGLLVVGGDVLADGLPYSASGNTVVVRLRDAIVADNVTLGSGGNNGTNVLVLGARCEPDICASEPGSPVKLAGTDNHALIHLRGASASVEVVAIDSEPLDPNGTNTAVVVRVTHQ